MGGLVARALLTLKNFKPELINLLITQATPHVAPVMPLDKYLTGKFTSVQIVTLDACLFFFISVCEWMEVCYVVCGLKTYRTSSELCDVLVNLSLLCYRE